MDTALEHLSKEQLIALVGERDRVIREKDAYASQLLALIDRFKRMAFAQTRERFEGNTRWHCLSVQMDQRNRNKGISLGKR